jgi:hypothetical protein
MTLFRMFQRRGTAAQWQSANTVLAVGEIGFSYDDNVIKIGDGQTAWNSLASLDGKSAYEIAVSNGFVGTQADWLTSLAGLPGQSGNSGKFLTTNGTAPSWSTIDLSSKQDKVANVSDAEIGYLDGVTSAIQTQLNSKASIASPAFTGTVSGTPANGVAATASSTIGFLGLPNAGDGGGTQDITAAKAGKHIYLTSSAKTVTIPSNASVPFEIGTTIVIVNGGTGSNSIEIEDDVLLQIGTGLNGPRQIAQHGMATLLKVEATKWYISGVGLT